jgi:hypothetical protein
MGEQPQTVRLGGNLVSDVNPFGRDVATIAGHLHDTWRSPRALEDGTYEPRIKPTTDQAWIESHGTDQVDIANTSYEELPSDWQLENKESAAAALMAVYKIAFYGEGRYGERNFLSFKHFVEWASSEVHDAWLDRSGQGAPPEQNLPYEKLSDDEKEKDRAIVQKNAALLVKQELDDGTFEVPSEMIMDWLQTDAQYLLDMTDRHAFELKRKAGQVHPSVTFESLQAELGGWKVENMTILLQDNGDVYFHLEIPQDRAVIDGNYGIVDVAKFLRIIRNNTPEVSDSHNHSHYSLNRREVIEEMDKHALLMTGVE